MKSEIKYAIANMLRTFGLSGLLKIPKKTMEADEYFKDCFTSYSPQKIVVFPSVFHKEPLPRTIDSSISWKFMSMDGRTIPEGYVVRLANGRVWGRNAAVITKDGVLLKDVSREFGRRKKHSAFSHLWLPNAKKIKGNLAVLLTAGANTYYHWIFDILPRLFLIQKAGLENDIDYYILPEIHLPYQKESLESIGIPIHKILEVKTDTFHIQAENLFVPSLPSLLGTVNGWAINFLQNQFLPLQKDAKILSNRIYVSRKKANARVVKNEDEIIELLKNHSFEILEAENYSFLEQVAIFNKADVVIASHGSGLSNIVFCKPGTKILELFSKDFMVPCFWVIANNSNLSYFYGSDGGSDAKPFSPYWDGIASDFIFPIEKLKELMQLAEVN